MTPPKKRKARMLKDRRGKWARDPWIRILELLYGMPPNERSRCLQATIQFFEGRLK